MEILAFSKMANAHRMRNTMAKVKINAVTLIEEIDIKLRVAQAFHSLLTEPSRECFDG